MVTTAATTYPARLSVSRAQPRERISGATAVMMLAVALWFDSLQALFGIFNVIPLIGTVVALMVGWGVSIVAWLTFFLWFLLHGVRFSDKGAAKAMALFGGAFIEMLPLLNMLPGWTLSVWLIIWVVRREDAAYNKNMKHPRLTS